MRKKAILVWKQKSMAGEFVLGGFSKIKAKRYLAKLKWGVRANDLNWDVELDDSCADFSKLENTGYDLFIMVPMNNLTYITPKKQIGQIQCVQLDSFEYYNYETEKVLDEMKQLTPSDMLQRSESIKNL